MSNRSMVIGRKVCKGKGSDNETRRQGGADGALTGASRFHSNDVGSELEAEGIEPV